MRRIQVFRVVDDVDVCDVRDVRDVCDVCDVCDVYAVGHFMYCNFFLRVAMVTRFNG